MVPSGLCNCTIYIQILPPVPKSYCKFWSTFQLPISLASLHGLTSLLLASHVPGVGLRETRKIGGTWFFESRVTSLKPGHFWIFLVTTLSYQSFPFFKQIDKDFSGTKLQLLPVLSRLTSCIACDCEALAAFFGI